MLESKNKVFQSIIKSLSNSEGIDTSEFKSKMNQLNERFASVTQYSQQWEQVCVLRYVKIKFKILILKILLSAEAYGVTAKLGKVQGG